MARLIDADALKESIDEHVYLVHHGFNETEYGCTQYGIHQIIDDAPTIDAVPRWIPVSEKLPDALDSVLVTSTGGHVYISYIVHGEFEYGGEVIAWMPLPEPYEGDKE